MSLHGYVYLETFEYTVAAALDSTLGRFDVAGSHFRRRRITRLK